MKFKESNILLLFLFAVLAGCDTVSHYRGESTRDTFSDIPTKTAWAGQRAMIDNGNVALQLYFFRFNFTMKIYFTINNTGTSSLFWVPGNVRMTGDKGQILPLEEFGNRNPHKKISNINEQIEIKSGESREFYYDFDGTPVMKSTHIQHSADQEKLIFKAFGLSRGENSIPLEISFKEIRQNH